jgi:hypothetical protein
MEYELLSIINMLGITVVCFIVFYHFIGLDDVQPTGQKVKAD